ncbi:MAG TPA: serine/threonine protein kinase [Gammaproteobacteria bacterium]|nr:serine/threonine protein kinase [Gammaproteobacteria bacterium]
MNATRLLTLSFAAVLLSACESGDINLSPTNVGTGGGGGGGGTFNPCASYSVAGTTHQGSYDGTNCTYDSAFVSESNPLTINLRIPRISGVHIFADSLYVGQNVEPPGIAPAAGTGPMLVIEAGSTLAFNASDNILINRGSRIMAEGTANEPIIFTGYEDAVARTAGPFDSQLWAGIVINGNALTNNCDDAQRAAGACHVLSEGKPSRYGGNDGAESSGVLRYVVVKHAGFDVTGGGDELNGVTFNAVGSGTVVENLEIYSGFDDGIEFFGGSVNVTNYVALYVRDDSIDFSDGYSGTVTNALVIHAPQNGNNCVEGDNIAVGRVPGTTPGAASTLPLTRPTISHMTCIVSNWDTGTHGASRGVIIRFGARAIITDSVIESGRGAAENGVAAPTNVCWEIDGASTPDSINAAQAGETTVNRTVISCQTPTTTTAPADTINGGTQTAWIMNTGTAPSAFNTNNAVLATTSFEDPTVTVLEPGTFFSFDRDTVNGQVTLGGPATSDIVLQVPDNYVGAVQSTANWTAGWTYGFIVGNRGIAPWWEQ